MISLSLHTQTRHSLELLTKNPVQAVLLSGEYGTGLGTIAKVLTGAQLSGIITPINSKGEHDEKQGTISIEVMRALHEQTRSRSTKQQFFIVDDADRMTLPAQNAFLKLLEEPAKTVHFILTSHSTPNLLPTILSRVQQVSINKLDLAATERFIDSLGIEDKETRQKIYFIASGLPAEIMRLHTDPAYFTDKAHVIGDAKKFIQGTLYDKLVIIHSYQTSREKAISLIEATIKIVRYTLSSHTTDDRIKQLNTLLHVQENVERNYSPRLQLLRFVL